MLGIIGLAVALSSCVYLLIATDMNRKWKGLALGLILASMAGQFLDLGVPVVVPVLMQVFVGIWGLIRMKLDLG